MRDILGYYLLLSVSLSAGYVLVTLIRTRRTRARLEEARRLAQASVLRYGGVIQPRRRIRPSPISGIDVLASCEAEAAEVIAANRGLGIRCPLCRRVLAHADVSRGGPCGTCRQSSPVRYI